MSEQSPASDAAPTKKPRPRFRKPVGPKLQVLLSVVFGLFALLVVNSVYLVSITLAGPEYQNWFYLVMFLGHLILGLLIVVPVIVFGVVHIRNTRNRPNRRAIRAGYALFVAAILVLLTGFVLTRVEIGGLELAVTHAGTRSLAYWLHVLCPLACIWLFVLHRLAGRRIKWRTGLTWAAVAAVFAVVGVGVHRMDPRGWSTQGPESGEQYFFPSLARTATGDFIPAEVLDNNEYCLQCHEDIHDSWTHSVHRMSSFNNPLYAFSVQQTRAFVHDRDGSVQASRFCAGCHDPVPFFTGSFDQSKWDDPDYDVAADPQGKAGITCTVCHAISHVPVPVRGNADYTITEPVHYPFAFAESDFLRWVNEQLVKAKPAFHKATFLKPLHQTTEFCSTCHKVHLPEELNQYKWLRGQNHHDAFWLSGVSGHGITSFYYPPTAQTNCNGCHMKPQELGPGRNFGAKPRGENGELLTLDHQFPSANIAIPHLLRDQLRDADEAIEAHREFNEGVMRVDLFGLRREGRIDGTLAAPIGPAVPELEPGERVLLETIVRTVKMGHLFTQGTADSNEVWVEVEARMDGELIGESGRIDELGEVDPWSHFLNAFVIDREGNRIDRRNAQDIFVALYNNQIPPGAAAALHYMLEVPEDADAPIEVTVRLRYRKFDRTIMVHMTEDPDYVNDLPILELAQDTVTFPVAGAPRPTPEAPDDFPEWQRWNDYGIGLLRSGQLRQAREAFDVVERLGRSEGPINLVRTYLQEGLVQRDAQAALARAAEMQPPAREWHLLWFGAQVASRNGDHEQAIANLRDILAGGFTQAEGRGFDFSKDYRVRNETGRTLYQLALASDGEERERYVREAIAEFEAALSYDSENAEAHWGLRQCYRDLGDDAKEAEHTRLHAKYKPDDNARDHAVAEARRKYPAADRLAERVVIHDLHRADRAGGMPLAFDLAAPESSAITESPDATAVPESRP